MGGGCFTWPPSLQSCDVPHPGRWRYVPLVVMVIVTPTDKRVNGALRVG